MVYFELKFQVRSGDTALFVKFLVLEVADDEVPI